MHAPAPRPQLSDRPLAPRTPSRDPDAATAAPARPSPPALIIPAARLAAMARQGSAAALRLLRARCLEGPVDQRAAALRLLPGLIPFQPVWPILEEADRPGAPPALRRAAERVRGLLDDPRDCEETYRALQRALCRGFVEEERGALPPALQRRPEARREALRLSLRVAAALYDYRFELSDGCIGDLRDRHVQEFLLEYAPQRLLLLRGDRPKVPQILVRHLSWLRRIGHLLPRTAHRLCLLALRLRPAYLEAALSPAQPGSARAALRDAAVDGVDPQDAGALGRYLTLHALDLHEELAPLFSAPAPSAV